MNPVNSLNYLLQHVSTVTAKQADKLLHDELGIGLSQYRILMALEWNPRVQQKTIADSLGQTEASISRQTKLLIGKGLLVASQDKTNRRKHLTLPTPKGMQITEAAGNLLRHSFHEDISRLDEDDIARLNDTLLKLHKIICRPGRLGACDHQFGF
jgi:DNA-binding MarR family transcriptional regulator